MVNHIRMADILRPSTYTKALSIYRKDINKICRNPKQMKDYLNNMNVFLYTYFIIKYNLDLKSSANRYSQKIARDTSASKLAKLGEEMLSDYANSVLTSQKNSDHELIDKALNYINSNFCEKITLEDVAKKLHISRNYLCCLFREETGYKFCEYINIQRVNRAKELIRENRKNLEYISYECGFNSQSHFCTTFKKFAGCTPKDYKKRTV